jgi:hypothetical protein
LWWLAIAPHSSRLLLVHTRGVTEGLDYRSYDDYHVADNVVDHHGRTIATYTTRFGCHVFSMDTSRLSIPPKRWNRIVSLGSYYLFLGVNYLLIIPVGLGPDNMTIGNYVYTLRHAIGLGYMPRLEICHFSLKAKDAAVGFSTNIRWVWRQLHCGSCQASPMLRTGVLYQLDKRKPLSLMVQVISRLCRH